MPVKGALPLAEWIPPLSTPALVVDLDIFEANVAAMAGLLRGTGKTVRPHVKTHRTPDLAKRQLGESAHGVTCATVGEAEIMVDAGIDDVFIANEVVDASKLARIAELARRATMSVAADAPEPVAALSREAMRRAVHVGVLIDVDILLHRCGVASIPEALVLARDIEHAPGLELRGLMGYEGRVRLSVESRARKVADAYAALRETREALVAAGHEIQVVSAAGTSTVREAIADPTITELQAGVYALMEPELLVMDLPFRCAVSIRGTVISSHADRSVVDVGRRVVGVEYGPPVPIGFQAERVAVSDEQTTVTMSDPPPLGSRVDFIPGQIRTTFNLHDHVWVTRGERIVDYWTVAARGSSQ
ncbi:MAG TPA: alanine racemase [Candidatus Limnocylindrales bacterium]|nr:alanine racemase [Candidatus Limnocylindrales bacterium]